MEYLDMGNGTGWAINEKLTQEEKVQIVLRATDHTLKTFESLVEIYAKYGTLETFSEFKNRVDEIMKKGSYESFFNDDNYDEKTDQS
jgi:hypothetical protein